VDERGCTPRGLLVDVQVRTEVCTSEHEAYLRITSAGGPKVSNAPRDAQRRAPSLGERLAPLRLTELRGCRPRGPHVKLEIEELVASSSLPDVPPAYASSRPPSTANTAPSVELPQPELKAKRPRASRGGGVRAPARVPWCLVHCKPGCANSRLGP
jgi:hypothetical protein